MKKIALFVVLSYWVFFFLTQPAQTPDEMGHYETVYWASHFSYPYSSLNFGQNLHPYGQDFANLFNLGNEDPNLILNYRSIRDSPLQKKMGYSQAEKAQFIPFTGQAYNPPLYYMVGAGFLNLAIILRQNLITQFYFVRLASSLMYFGTVIVFYRILKVLFSDSSVRKSLLLLFALNPLFLQSGIGISPDIAVGFFSTLFLWVVLRRLKTNTLFQPTSLVILGLISGLAALCKISGVFLIPSFICYLYILRRKLVPWFVSSTLYLLTFIVTQIPWTALNYVRYHRLVVENVALGAVESPSRSISVFSAIVRSLIDFRHTFMHFSGFLGWNDAFPFSFIFIPFTLILVLLMMVGIISSVKSRRPSDWLILLTSCSLMSFFFILAFERKIYFHPGWDIGGRNILPIFPQMLLFVAFGLRTIFKKNQELVFRCLSFFSIFYYFFILIFVLLPRYYV